MTLTPWVQWYGIWSPSEGWWYANSIVFHTEYYAVAVAQLDVVQRHFSRIFDKSIHWEVRKLPDPDIELGDK